VRSVRATWGDGSSAGWQWVKMSRSRSSAITLASLVAGCSGSPSLVSSASRAARSATVRFRRSRSMARRRSVTLIQAAGLQGRAVGTPGRCSPPHPPASARAAGLRWPVEEGFEFSKDYFGHIGLHWRLSPVRQVPFQPCTRESTYREGVGYLAGRNQLGNVRGRVRL